MATKIQFKYGQYTREQGLSMTTDMPGLVVFSGLSEEIYVDNKAFGFRDMFVNAYEQAKIETLSEGNMSQLLIANIGQGKDENGNDGKIYSTGNFVVNIDGSYQSDSNKLATQTTVKTAVDKLRAEILGTVNPDELEKTLDTIKEIQDVLTNGSYTIKDANGNAIPTKRVVVKNESGEIVSIKYTNGVVGDGEVIYATEDVASHDIEYVDGYSDLTKVASIDDFVANVLVDANKDNDFVSQSRDKANVTIGVKYGTFKTGHGNVMDATSTAFVNGIATVEDVQKYIEERLSWITYETSPSTVAELINNSSESNVVINNSSNLSGSLVITNPQNNNN